MGDGVIIDNESRRVISDTQTGPSLTPEELNQKRVKEALQAETKDNQILETFSVPQVEGLIASRNNQITSARNFSGGNPLVESLVGKAMAEAQLRIDLETAKNLAQLAGENLKTKVLIVSLDHREVNGMTDAIVGGDMFGVTRGNMEKLENAAIFTRVQDKHGEPKIEITTNSSGFEQTYARHAVAAIARHANTVLSSSQIESEK